MKIIITVALAMVMWACPGGQPIEMTARDSVAAAKGYLDSAKAKHPECASGTRSADCSVIVRGVAAKDLVIDALNAYCASPDYNDKGGPCVPNKDAGPKLKEAMHSLDDIMKNVKLVGGIQ